MNRLVLQCRRSKRDQDDCLKDDGKSSGRAVTEGRSWNEARDRDVGHEMHCLTWLMAAMSVSAFSFHMQRLSCHAAIASIE
jgi:hypothetical protein